MSAQRISAIEEELRNEKLKLKQDTLKRTEDELQNKINNCRHEVLAYRPDGRPICNEFCKQKLPFEKNKIDDDEIERKKVVMKKAIDAFDAIKVKCSHDQLKLRCRVKLSQDRFHENIEITNTLPASISSPFHTLDQVSFICQRCNKILQADPCIWKSGSDYDVFAEDCKKMLLNE